MSLFTYLSSITAFVVLLTIGLIIYYYADDHKPKAKPKAKPKKK